MSKMSKDRYCLVIGSKPGSNLPDIRPKKIYSANGAAIRVKPYLKNNSVDLTAIMSSGAAVKQEECMKVLEVNPQSVVLRSHRNYYDNKDTLIANEYPDTQIIKVKGWEQFKL